MWDPYKRRPRKRRVTELAPYASVNARGEIVLNRTALKLIDGAINIVISYDADLKRLGIYGATQKDSSNHIFQARRYGRGRRSRIIRAKRVIEHFGIRIDRTLAFTAFEVEPGPMLVLDFSKAVTVGHEIAKSQV